MRSKFGFTLVEIMIVVAIIGLLSVLVIPNLVRSRLNANEAVAQGTLKTVASACEAFRAAQSVPTYPNTLAVLVNSNPSYLADVIDTVTTGTAKNGYMYTYARINITQYVCAATPQTYGASGIRTFAINESGTIRAIDNGGVVVNDQAGYEAMAAVQ